MMVVLAGRPRTDPTKFLIGNASRLTTKMTTTWTTSGTRISANRLASCVVGSGSRHSCKVAQINADDSDGSVCTAFLLRSDNVCPRYNKECCLRQRFFFSFHRRPSGVIAASC